MADHPAHLPPVRRQIVVPTDPADAFRLWTDELSAWWPFDGHSVFGSDATVAFVDGVLVERSANGDSCPWGTVLDWQPGSLLRLTWHPGGGAEQATEVMVQFSAVDVADGNGPHTLVTLEHSGWERRADAADARRNYDGGWTTVIARFGESARPRDLTWLVLAHSAGPNAPADGPLFAHPDFGEHVAFLERLAERGVLVAAGPLAALDERPTGAEGMTVIRVPGDEVEAFRALAAEDDQAVVRGLLDVRVRRWAVAVS